MSRDRISNLPPFFTQVIGSLPRPQIVRELLANRGEIAEERFQKTLDDFVVFAVRLQFVDFDESEFPSVE